jgi:hypothetical protein
MVVSEKLPLSNCPHLSDKTINHYQPEIDAQHAAGKWVRKEPAEEGLKWARQRASSMRLEDLPDRIGGELQADDHGPFLELGYFDRTLRIRPDGISACGGPQPDRWEKTFVYNHLAQGGSARPSGAWNSFEETVTAHIDIESILFLSEHLRRRLCG